MISRLKMFFQTSVVLLMFLSVEVHANILDDIIERGTLRIGVSLFVPWTMEDESGQLSGYKIDETKTVAMPLQPGEISMHNVRLAHASTPNRSTNRRIGISLHYLPPCTKQIVGEWDSAALVRGEDRFGHFSLTPCPSRDFDPVTVSFHERATKAVRDIFYKDAEKVRQIL